MVLHLFGSKPLNESIMTECRFNLGMQVSEIVNETIFSHKNENEFENVCKSLFCAMH